jgi:hypothetical protein
VDPCLVIKQHLVSCFCHIVGSQPAAAEKPQSAIVEEKAENRDEKTPGPEGADCMETAEETRPTADGERRARKQQAAFLQKLGKCSETANLLHMYMWALHLLRF